MRSRGPEGALSQFWKSVVDKTVQEVLSKWNKKLLCTGQPTVALVAEAAGKLLPLCDVPF